MRQKLFWGIVLFICLILQSALFSRWNFFSSNPNLLLVLTVSLAFLEGRRAGVTYGFIAGLMIDLTGTGLIGFHALLFTVTGYGCGSLHALFFNERRMMPSIMLVVSCLVIDFFTYLCFFFLRGKTDIVRFFVSVMIPDMLSSLIVILIIYPLLVRINRCLSGDSKKGRRVLWIKE